jgi:hypothetical protein
MTRSTGATSISNTVARDRCDMADREGRIVAPSRASEGRHRVDGADRAQPDVGDRRRRASLRDMRGIRPETGRRDP